MKQLLPGVHTWAWFSEPKQMNFNGLRLELEPGGAAVAVDPPPWSAGELRELQALGPLALIVLTNKDHTRRAQELKAATGAPIAIHAADAPLIDFAPDRTFADGELLPGGLRVVQVGDAKSPGECALHHAGRRILVVGDAVIAHPPGQLRLVPAEKLRDPAAARAALRRLLELDFDALLVGDGESFPSGGKLALQRFLEA